MLFLTKKYFELCFTYSVNEEFHPAKSGYLSPVIELIYMSPRTSLQ